jgi:hypothetical protein
MLSRKSLTVFGIAFVLAFVLGAIAKVELDRGLIKKKIALVKMDLQNIDTALEAYSIDYNFYPAPDFDSEGTPLITKRLLSSYTKKPFIFIGMAGPPTAHDTISLSSIRPYTPSYINKLPYDPFNLEAKGLYRYATDMVHGDLWRVTNAFIISSYGPDQVNGYGTTKFNLENFVYDSDRSHPDWADKESIAPYLLQTSPFTYDPTNGLISGGDIWRRGP